MDVFVILFACLVSPFVPAKTPAPEPSAIPGGVYSIQAPSRSDVFDAKSNRIGYVKTYSTGRQEIFDVRSNRIGSVVHSR